MRKVQPKEKVVLVGVLKQKRDLEIILKERWYRIPIDYAPKRQFDYLAFYQPLSFGKEGKQIKYFAEVFDFKKVKRKDLLPSEINHPRFEKDYFQIRLKNIQKLSQPIKNIHPRRISFGFTTLSRFLTARDVLQLYNVPPLENIVEKGLKNVGIKVLNQYRLTINKKRFRLDFAIFCRKGKIAIECDNRKAHSNSLQKEKDKIKDEYLKNDGWEIIRLKENAVLSKLDSCLLKIQKTIQKLGGIAM